ncbi:dnaJ homolog subfamily C member 28 [Osmerus mordax]|uniref:dnaJ homolog subfamily C member 28 n=1 Tax=Osmerus mordax TaxID=8014 RepID=UPI00350F7CA0
MILPYLAPQLLLLRTLSSKPFISNRLRDNYRALQLPEDGESSPAQVKEAYLSMAKLYHPDSGTATADAALFARVEEAYRAVLAHKRQIKASGAENVEEEEEDSMKGMVPQHRHYLSYEGIGLGTPSQRERQYQQFRVDRAVGQVLDYRQKEHERAAAEEGEIVVRDKRSRQIKITQAVERLVEDLIQESMARGDFRNLSGSGKPINKFDHNPYADPMTHNLNRILIDNGYQPPWIVMQRDIRETTAQLRERLLKGRAKSGESMTLRENAQWQQLCGSIGEELVNLNKMVDNFNLVVPMLSRQMVHFSLDREIAIAEKAAYQHRQEREMERETEKERREERKKTKVGTQQTTQGLLSWMQNLLK